MAHVGPGKAHRQGISLLELAAMFPDEPAARKWFEDQIRPDGVRWRLRCGSENTNEFAGRHNLGDRDTIDQMNAVVCGLVGKPLLYRKLTAPSVRSGVAT